MINDPNCHILTTNKTIEMKIMHILKSKTYKNFDCFDEEVIEYITIHSLEKQQL